MWALSANVEFKEGVPGCNSAAEDFIWLAGGQPMTLPGSATATDSDHEAASKLNLSRSSHLHCAVLNQLFAASFARRSQDFTEKSARTVKIYAKLCSGYATLNGNLLSTIT